MDALALRGRDAVLRFPDRDALGDLERRVLDALDAPLNLGGSTPSEVGARLTSSVARSEAPDRRRRVAATEAIVPSRGEYARVSRAFPRA